MVLLSIKERYKEVFNTLLGMFIGAIYSIITIPLLITILPVLWIDGAAVFFAKFLHLEIYDDWED